jgi:ABC-2 type transport system ATP-binding protein/lipopolysaccharide transport system ATP-binding protein
VSALLDLGAGFHPELSGRENIFLNGAILGLTRREIARAFDDIVDFAGLAEFIDSPVKVYSTGMYVRLGFSVAVHVKPEILIIDEVIAVGDAEFQRRCFDHLYTLKRQGVTIVLVSHGLSIMQDMCDRLAWLDHGRLAAEGRPMDVIREYIHHVDDQEAERLLGAKAVDANPSSRRMGSHEIEIESFQVLNAMGEPIPMAITGEPTTLRITYHAKAPVENPTFGISIDHENGTPLAVLHTGDSTETGTLFGRGYIDYQIPRFTLMPGKMIVTLGVADPTNTHAYDYLYQWFEFHVRAGTTVVPRGMVELVGHWDAPVSEASRELTG